MKPILIFYHKAEIGDHWQETFSAQMERLNKSKMPAVQFFAVKVGKPDNKGEIPTIEFMVKTLNDLADDFNVLYFHSKGVSYKKDDPKLINVEAWREFLEYFVIDMWATCQTLLNYYDVVCPTWLDETWAFNGHPTGNFYWATSAHIKSLPPVDSVPVADMFKASHAAEFFIGNKKDIKPFEFVNIPQNVFGDFFYKRKIQENEYKGKIQYPITLEV